MCLTKHTFFAINSSRCKASSILFIVIFLKGPIRMWEQRSSLFIFKHIQSRMPPCLDAWRIPVPSMYTFQMSSVEHSESKMEIVSFTKDFSCPQDVYVFLEQTFLGIFQFRADSSFLWSYCPTVFPHSLCFSPLILIVSARHNVGT